MAGNDGKYELTFIPTARRTSHTIEDPLLAYAKRFQSLIIMNPGDIPSCLPMGIGIYKYSQDFADDTTLYAIKNDIISQKEKYLPSGMVNDVDVSVVPNKLDSGASYILVVVASLSYAYTTAERDRFGMTFYTSTNKQTIVSDLYF